MIRIDIVITIALPLSFCYNKDKPRGCTPRVLLAITYACEAWVFAFFVCLDTVKAVTRPATAVM